MLPVCTNMLYIDADMVLVPTPDEFVDAQATCTGCTYGKPVIRVTTASGQLSWIIHLVNNFVSDFNSSSVGSHLSAHADVLRQPDQPSAKGQSLTSRAKRSYRSVETRN